MPITSVLLLASSHTTCLAGVFDQLSYRLHTSYHQHGCMPPIGQNEHYAEDIVILCTVITSDWQGKLVHTYTNHAICIFAEKRRQVSFAVFAQLPLFQLSG